MTARLAAPALLGAVLAAFLGPLACRHCPPIPPPPTPPPASLVCRLPPVPVDPPISVTIAPACPAPFAACLDNEAGLALEQQLRAHRAWIGEVVRRCGTLPP